MTGEKTGHSRRVLRDYLIVGFFALLGISEIIFVVTGVQRLDDIKSWIAFAGAILIVGLLVVVLVGRVAGFIVEARQPVGQKRTPVGSVFEMSMEGFDSRYEELLGRIDRLPDTGRKAESDRKKRLLEIVIALKEIKDKLLQMSGTYPYKEDLQELEMQLARQSLELLDIHSTFATLWTRFKTRGTGFYQGFNKTLIEAIELEMLLTKNLERAKKKGKKKEGHAYTHEHELTQERAKRA